VNDVERFLEVQRRTPVEVIMSERNRGDLEVIFDLLNDFLEDVQAELRERGAEGFRADSDIQVNNIRQQLQKMRQLRKGLEAWKTELLELVNAESVEPRDSAPPAGPVSRMPSPGALRMSYGGAKALLQKEEGGFVLLAGSLILKHLHPSFRECDRTLRDQSERDGTLIPTDNPRYLKLARNIGFRSLSAAARYVAGCSVNGKREWKEKPKEMRSEQDHL
jgi:hypothetical protein